MADDGMIYGIAAPDVISSAVPFRNDRLSKVLILCISSQTRTCNFAEAFSRLAAPAIHRKPAYHPFKPRSSTAFHTPRLRILFQTELFVVKNAG
jgi:hypothetical protein